jgi:nitrogen fixation/metabolism regulation signal transduction histidine kinase
VLTINGAAGRLLGIGAEAYGRPATEVFDRDDLGPLRPFVAGPARRPTSGSAEQITVVRDDRETHLAVAATTLVGEGGQAEGSVIVFDDITPLLRAQRVAAWRDVARRLAHEIKNPLTPIQLSAERLRRHFGGAPPPSRALVAECTDAIITEVDSLRGLVDEFAEFARLRAPRLTAQDVNRLIDGALQLYAGLLVPDGVRITRRFDPAVPRVLIDAEQLRQVIRNLVDNALEALGGPAAPRRPDGSQPEITITTSHLVDREIVRIVLADNGPGVPAADRDKLFMPYYSTKGRGSGLGLAIVRRIVAEHGGSIDVADAVPSGTAFTIDLPCQPS